MDAGSQGLIKAERLRRRGDFLRVQRRGRSVSVPLLVVATIDNGLDHRRLGVTVSSRIGNAVERNRVKRWLRELYRKHRSRLPEGVDVVLIARRGSPEAGYRRLEAAFLTCADRLRGG